jgi:NADP-dependent 3-hydroxy acid dehydrogenase YdfG
MILQGTAAIVTGASSGIGAAVAQELSAAGVHLLLTARREERLREVACKCKNACILPGDITDPSLPHRLIDECLRLFSRCDIVFNNAGIVEVGAIDKIDIDRVCEMVRINVEAVFRMAYVALKHFRAANCGHLVNTSSIMGTKVRPTAGAYAGTKHAIEALSEALRMELAGSNISVSCIEPGLVLSEFHNRWEVHPTVSMGISQPLTPQDIARYVRFVLEQPPHIRIPRLMVLPHQQQL